MAEIGSVHQLEILFVLSGGASGDFVEPFAEVAVIGAAKFIKSVKEMIVAGDAGGRNEAAHGE